MGLFNDEYVEIGYELVVMVFGLVTRYKAGFTLFCVSVLSRGACWRS